jgi:hypothetical protein
VVDAHDLEQRRRIFAAFAATGAPPADPGELTALAEQHVVALDDDGHLLMAHPFAAHRQGARVEAQGRTWWGNCAWDGLGIVHALGLRDATVTAQGLTIGRDDVAFHVLVPAAHWWDDIGFT